MILLLVDLICLNRTFYGIETPDGVSINREGDTGLNRTFYGIETRESQ